jgi:tripartite-type tricarboxylate transporter receptor subunit TctC
MIAPSPAGGPSDFAARLLAPKLGDYLKQNIVVDNRQSVNGVIATEMVAKAPPDGLTLGIGNNGTHVINTGLYKNLPYDPIRDFIPVSQLISNGSALVGHIKFAPKTLKELIAYAKANPGKINVGVAGANGAVGTEVFKSAMGIVLNNVPYKGSAPAEVAVISGEVELVQLSIPVVAPHYKSGRLKVYGIMSAKRSPLLPDVQTISEQGVAGYEASGNWHGVFVPAKTPDRIVRILHREIVRVFEAQDIRDITSNRGSELIVNTPEQFAEQLKRDVPRFRKIMLDAGIVPQAF